MRELHSQESKQIKKAWELLCDPINNLSWHNYADRLLELTTEETRAHNRGRPTDTGITQATEARYFAVKRLVEYLRGDKAPDPADYIGYQTSCFYAYSMSVRLKDTIKPIYEKNKALFDLVADLDYCYLAGIVHESDRKKPYTVINRRGYWCVGHDTGTVLIEKFGPFNTEERAQKACKHANSVEGRK